MVPPYGYYSRKTELISTPLSRNFISQACTPCYSKWEDSGRRLGSIPRRNLARENRSGIRREPHDLRAGRLCGFRVVSSTWEGKTRGDFPTRQGGNRQH